MISALFVDDEPLLLPLPPSLVVPPVVDVDVSDSASPSPQPATNNRPSVIC